MSLNIICFLVLIISSSCATIPPIENDKAIYSEDVQVLKRQVAYMDYENRNKWCFIERDICQLKDRLEEKGCWEEHEKCVISNYKLWKTIKSRLNIK